MVPVSSLVPGFSTVTVDGDPGERYVGAMPAPSLPPVTTFPHPAIFQALGAGGIQNLVRAVYRRIGQSAIAGMFPQGEAALEAAADKSALFFVGICGGPALYEQKFGPPRMRMRHQDFPIDDRARLVWLGCWEEVLQSAPDEFGFPREHLDSLRAYLTTFSQWMVNR